MCGLHAAVVAKFSPIDCDTMNTLSRTCVPSAVPLCDIAAFPNGMPSNSGCVVMCSLCVQSDSVFIADAIIAGLLVGVIAVVDFFAFVGRLFSSTFLPELSLAFCVTLRCVCCYCCSL